MKFREYGDVEPLILVSGMATMLAAKIQEVGNEREIIDLQYSTTTLKTGAVEYSALLLVGKFFKKAKTKTKGK